MQNADKLHVREAKFLNHSLFERGKLAADSILFINAPPELPWNCIILCVINVSGTQHHRRHWRRRASMPFRTIVLNILILSTSTSSQVSDYVTHAVVYFAASTCLELLVARTANRHLHRHASRKEPRRPPSTHKSTLIIAISNPKRAKVSGCYI
jgi:hypothetical protein